MKRLNLIFIILLISGYCKKTEKPIYMPTPQALNLGSLYYANSEGNCKSCHGVDYKGKGPDAKDLQVEILDFTSEIPPEKTPYDYFMAISIGTSKTVKDGYNYHQFYSYTDAAKWAMANFLYSLAKDPSDIEKKKIKQESYAKRMQEVKEFYKHNRKWYLGDNTPSIEREKSPALNEMIQKTNFQLATDYSFESLTEQRVNQIYEARENYEYGYYVYKYKCQNCHGIGGEGIQGVKSLGLMESRSEYVREIARRKNSFISIPSLTKAKINQKTLNEVHPDIYLSEIEGIELINYLNAIVEK